MSTEYDSILITTESEIYQILFNLKLMITDELFFFNYFFFSLINIIFFNFRDFKKLFWKTKIKIRIILIFFIIKHILYIKLINKHFLVISLSKIMKNN